MTRGSQPRLEANRSFSDFLSTEDASATTLTQRRQSAVRCSRVSGCPMPQQPVSVRIADGVRCASHREKIQLRRSSLCWRWLHKNRGLLADIGPLPALPAAGARSLSRLPAEGCPLPDGPPPARQTWTMICRTESENRDQALHDGGGPRS